MKKKTRIQLRSLLMRKRDPRELAQDGGSPCGLQNAPALLGIHLTTMQTIPIDSNFAQRALY